ncbi:tape measure protein [uncultured Agathobaculum sp.]|uniref:tape measure protein n=1 Tax=uncultured Agathobaculum sp. TaxID=2048140 RepID=UPI003208E36F
MPDVSIALSAKDNYTTTLKKIADATRTGVKSIESLQQSLDTLNKTRVSVQLNMTKVKNELREAKKRFEETGDAADELAMKDKQFELNNLASQLKAVNANAIEAEKSMRTLAGTNSKIANRQSAAGGSSAKAGSSGSMLGTVGSALATAGFGDMLSNSLSGAAGAFFGSYYGTTDGAAIESFLGSAISGATMGAAAGSMVAPGIGTAIGAAAGGLIGAVSGGIEAATQKFTEKDEAFKAYVQEATEGVLEEQATALTNGSAIAGSREQTKMAFAKALGGDETADAYLEQVREMATRTNYTYDEITAYTKQLLNSYAPDEILSVLGDLSDATAGLDLTSSDVSLWVSGLNRMRITDKATLEYLNYFSERGLNVYEALSQALGVQESAVQDMISDGKVSGTQAADAILDYIGEQYGGLSERLASSYEGLMGNIEDANADLQAAMGEGYNEARKAGLQEQLDWMNGEMGASMQQAYEQIGAFQASLENTREQMVRDVMDAVMTGVMPEDGFEAQLARLQEMAEEYASAASIAAAQPADSTAAQQAQADMGRLLAEAQVMAQNEYNASEGAQILLESQLTLAQQVAADTSADATYYNAGLRLGQQYTKGISAAIASYRPQTITIPVVTGSIGTSAGVATGTFTGTTTGSHLTGATSPYRAIGENRVPRDNTLYLLHEGERVLTAREARAQDQGGTGGVNIYMGGNYTVRQDSDIGAIAEAVAARIMAQVRILR